MKKTRLNGVVVVGTLAITKRSRRRRNHHLRQGRNWMAVVVGGWTDDGAGGVLVLY